MSVPALKIVGPDMVGDRSPGLEIVTVAEAVLFEGLGSTLSLLTVAVCVAEVRAVEGSR